VLFARLLRVRWYLLYETDVSVGWFFNSNIYFKSFSQFFLQAQSVVEKLNLDQLACQDSVARVSRATA